MSYFTQPIRVMLVAVIAVGFVAGLSSLSLVRAERVRPDRSVYSCNPARRVSRAARPAAAPGASTASAQPTMAFTALPTYERILGYVGHQHREDWHRPWRVRPLFKRRGRLWSIVERRRCRR